MNAFRCEHADAGLGIYYSSRKEIGVETRRQEGVFSIELLKGGFIIQLHATDVRRYRLCHTAKLSSRHRETHCIQLTASSYYGFQVVDEETCFKSAC